MIHDAVASIRRLPKRPWLILGKGPSLDLRAYFDLFKYNTLSLNHACKVHPVTVAHFCDLEALAECYDTFGDRPNVAMPWVPNLVMPWFPHKDMAPGHYHLADLVQQGDRVLTTLEAQGRLWAYNSTRVPESRYRRGLTEVRVRYFSAVAAFNLLVAAGVKKVHTLGVDGGRDYAEGFDRRNLLANKQPSFDIQFKEIQRSVHRHGVRWVCLADTL